MSGAPFAAALVVVGLLFAAAGAAIAQTPAQPNGPVTFLSGEQLLDVCGANDPGARNGCTGFAIGVADTAAEASAGGSLISSFRVCRPEDVTGSQARDVIVKFLQTHPTERQSHSAAGLAIQALAEAWPCAQ